MPDYAHGYDLMTDQELLEKVRKGWNCKQTPCGTGSTIAETAQIRGHLPKIAERYGVRTVADAGAGDLHWLPLVEWDVEYQGFDLYPRHPDVTPFDITKEILPKVDLILCRHVLNHLSIRFSERAIENFKLSGSRYLLMTNCDNQAAYWREFELDIGEPIRTFPDTHKWRLELYLL